MNTAARQGRHTASTRRCHPRHTTTATHIRRATHHPQTSIGTHPDIKATTTPARVQHPPPRRTPAVAAAAVAVARTIITIIKVNNIPHQMASTTITTCSCPTDPRTGLPTHHQTRTTHASGTTPSRPAPATTATGGDRHAPSTKKKKCTSSGTTGSTCVRSGRKSARVSTSSSPVASGVGSRVSSANSTGSSRRRSVRRFGNNGVCEMASSFERELRWGLTRALRGLV